MDIPEKIQPFSREELHLIVEKMDETGIITDSEEPLITHYMAFKWWGYDCINYIKEIGDIDYEIKIDEDNTDGPVRFLYDPERYTREDAMQLAREA